MSAGTQGGKRWFTAALLVVVLVPILAFGFQTGRCVDFTAEAIAAGAESYCTSGPAIGVVGAWVVTVAAVIIAAIAVYRGLLLRRRH